MSRSSSPSSAPAPRGTRWALVFALAAAGCTATVGGENGAGGGAAPGSGGANTSGTGNSSGTNPGGGSGAVTAACQDGMVHPGRAPIRRLTRFEYNNTVRDLFGDTTQPATSLPSEELGNGFGNDADTLSVSSLLAEQWGTVAEGIAQRATATPEALGRLAACAANVTADGEAACARTIIESLAPRAYRRPLVAGEADELLALQQAVRPNATFAVSIATVIEALLQTPDFLYRVEFGAPDAARPDLLRPTAHEMATRLSYLFWGTTPDDTLRTAAQAGELTTKESIRSHAERMLADTRSRPIVRFFFDNLLPISGLSDLERDAALFPTFTRSLGALMREETQQFLQAEIFEGTGTWPSILTAPYTYVNGPLAAFYGIQGVTGDTFQKVPLDTTQRLGLLTQAGVMAGTTHSNMTNPVVRGSFVVQKLMCRVIPLPTGAILEQVKPPEPYSGPTARQRFSAHSQNMVCAGCHQYMDPVGFAFENYDAVGLYRTTENDVAIDTSGAVPGMEGTVSGPIELVRKLAESEEGHACFATHWVEYAYGVSLRPEDACAKEAATAAFKTAGYNVKQLLIELTQTDAFLYMAPR